MACYLDLIWIEILENKFFSRNEVARPVMGTIFLVCANIQQIQ